MDLTPQHVWASMGIPAKLVVFTLLIMLFWSVYVAIERTILFVKARSQSRAVADAISKPLSQGNLDAALKVCKDEAYKASYLATVLRAGLGELVARPDRHGLDAVKRVIDRVATQENASLRKGLNVLATTGSTAPFVGLVGTIMGIINAFTMMSKEGGGDLTAISGGIAEALVTTAVGIGVAIVAIWIYNYFNAVLDDIAKDVDTSSKELIDWCEKEILRRSESQAAK